MLNQEIPSGQKNKELYKDIHISFEKAQELWGFQRSWDNLTERSILELGIWGGIKP